MQERRQEFIWGGQFLKSDVIFLVNSQLGVKRSGAISAKSRKLHVKGVTTFFAHQLFFQCVMLIYFAMNLFVAGEPLASFEESNSLGGFERK